MHVESGQAMRLGGGVWLNQVAIILHPYEQDAMCIQLAVADQPEGKVASTWSRNYAL